MKVAGGGKLLTDWQILLPTLTTNVSRAAVERYIRVGAAPKNKIMFMPNGIDTAKFKPNKAAGQRLRNELGVDNYFVWLAVGAVWGS